MGLVVNRASDFTVGELLDQLHITGAPEALSAQRVLAGGPVQPERGFVLHDDPRPWASTLRFGQGLAVTTSRDILASVGKEGLPSEIIVSLGYAGWDAGQLEEELAQNSWLTVPAKASILFELPPEERLPAAMQKLGVSFTQLSDVAGHA